jgi:ABC-type glycerol-3-phosphate transport system substrate-binding protein
MLTLLAAMVAAVAVAGCGGKSTSTPTRGGTTSTTNTTSTTHTTGTPHKGGQAGKQPSHAPAY